MGIKDNFAQAVKELMERDNLVGKKSDKEQSKESNELNRYLRESEAADEKTTVQPQPQQPFQQQPQQPFQQQPQQPFQQQPQQPFQEQPQEHRLETPYYVNDAAPSPLPPPPPSPAPQAAEYARPVPPPPPPARPAPAGREERKSTDSFIDDSEEMTVISRNTMIDGNIRSFANMSIDGNIKGNVETTKNIEMSGKLVGDITCNNMGMHTSAMQGNCKLKGRIKVDRDTLLIGDLFTQYADINGKIKGNIEVSGKAEFKRDSVVFGDISASTIAVIDGAIIQGYVNTTFLNKEDSKNLFPDSIVVGE